MTIINHVNLGELKKTIERARANPEETKKTVTIEGEWFPQTLMGPQFSAKIKAEKGEFTLSSDKPTFLGGGGSAPSPIRYCIYGACGCYAAAFANAAAFNGVVLKSFKIKVTANIDRSRALGLSQNPAVKEMAFELFVETDADDEKIAEVERIAYERCTAVYCLTSNVAVKTKVTKI